MQSYILFDLPSHILCLPSNTQWKLLDSSIVFHLLLSHRKEHRKGHRHTKSGACEFTLQTTCFHKNVKEVNGKVREYYYLFDITLFPSLMNVAKTNEYS